MGYLTTRIVLNTLAEEASRTKGATFTISFGHGEWRVNMPNQWERDSNGQNPITKVFKNKSLLNVAKAATKYIVTERKEIPPIKKEYTLLE